MGKNIFSIIKSSGKFKTLRNKIKTGYLIDNFDLHATEKTSTTELQSLLDKIKPMSTDKNLIRLGPQGDGGYLVPDDLTGIEACFSPGVDYQSKLELECANMGMKVFMADKSVKKPAESHESFYFTQKYIGVVNSDDFITMDEWVNYSLPQSNGDLLLQMDIEGFEYEVFLSMSNALLSRFRIIVIEFHNLNELWNKIFFDLTSHLFDKILSNHTCVHSHPNNGGGVVKFDNIEIPRLMELTFFRNDRIIHKDFAQTFPHPLDCDNTKYPSVVLPKCWYHSEK